MIPSNRFQMMPGLQDALATGKLQGVPQAAWYREQCNPPKLPGSFADPAREARLWLDTIQVSECSSLRFWQDTFWCWQNGAYHRISNSEIESLITDHLANSFTKVGRSLVSNVLMHVRSQTMIPSWRTPPCWLDDNAAGWEKHSCVDLLICKNGIVHLPTYVENGATYMREATPSLFSMTALDFDFDAGAPPCDEWLKFLRCIWGDDQESIDTLQEWFGYSLTPDARLQKILVLIGPKRSGKGTINRVLQALLGESNCCSPTFASLQTTFGLWPFLGKSIATFSDARLSGRSDQAVITERLLSISGEDAQTVDRKNLPPIVTKLRTRLVIISNELPRLTDASGALTGRFLMLRLTKSFFGNEDTGLTEELLSELPGILLWAIDGWRRLRERGRFLQPRSGLALVEQMENLASPMQSFIDERCVVEGGIEVPVDALYQEWRNWCETVGREPGTCQSFGRDLATTLPHVSRVQHRNGRARFRSYRGISLDKANGIR